MRAATIALLALCTACGETDSSADPIGDAGTDSMPDGAPDAGPVDAAPADVEAPRCDGTEVRLEGTIGDETISNVLVPKELSAPLGTRLTWLEVETTVALADLGGAYLHAQPAPGVAVATRGIALLPDHVLSAAGFYCAGDGTGVEFFDGPRAAATLRDLSFIGNCPGGEPVSGEIDLCLADELDAPSVGCTPLLFSSTLPDATFETVYGVGVTSTRWEVSTALVDVSLLDSGTLVQEADPIEHEVTGVATAPLPRGFFIVPQYQPDAGAVYCIEAGELSYRTVGGGVVPLRVRLTKLTRLGSCDEATPVGGSLGLCSSLDP